MSAAAVASKCGEKNARGEGALDFLEDKNESGEWRIEGGGESGTTTGGDEDEALGLGDTEDAADHFAHGTTHLDGGSLAPEGESAADGEHAAGELYEEQGRPVHLAEIAQDCFELGDPAAGGGGRKMAHEPEAHGDTSRREQGGNHEPGEAIVIAENSGAGIFRPVEHGAEGGGDGTGDDADQHGAQKDPPPKLANMIGVLDGRIDVLLGERYGRLPTKPPPPAIFRVRAVHGANSVRLGRVLCRLENPKIENHGGCDIGSLPSRAKGYFFACFDLTRST